MTAVIFKFSLPDGTPVADAPFLVTTRKPSFDETLNNGIQVSGDVSGITDAQGEATLTLMAGFATYYLLMDNPGAEPGADGCTAGLRYRFMVPESAIPVRVEDLIVTTPTWSRPWDETALQIIIDAKVSATASADAAHASEVAAGEFAVRAEDAESASALSAQAAAASELAAGQSKDTAHADMLTTEGYRNEAEASKDAARVSELAAAASADFAAGAVVDMQEQVDEATLQAGNAATSAGQAAASEAAAEADRLQTAQDVITTTTNKNATAADVVTITGLKSDVVALKDETLGYRDDALEALGSITGVISDGGPIDLSGGVYPAKPAMSTVWQVTVAGTVDTITYNVGDQLFYTKDLDYFYQMDNTSQVRTVAGRMGDVVLDKADVGLPLVDNTPDADKPISTAQATGLGLKIDKTSIVDDLTSTDATKVLSAKQGKALYDLVQANNATLVVYEFTATLGQTVFSGADDNGLSLVYQVGPGTLVFLNGVQLQKTDDYSATTGISLTMVNPSLQAGDLIQILAFGSFSVANHYTKAEDDVLLANRYTKAEADALLLTKASKSDTDTKFADRYTKAEDDAKFVQKTDVPDPWLYKPLGEPFPLMTHIAGVSAPPTNNAAYRYIKLTAGDSYNTGVLGSESNTGAAPLVIASAVVTLAGSPMNGQTVQLINTESRIIRPSTSSGSLLQDALQNITGSVAALFRAAAGGNTGALGATQYGATPPKAGVQGTDAGDSCTVTFDASLMARTSNETRMKSIGATYYMRIK